MLNFFIIIKIKKAEIFYQNNYSETSDDKSSNHYNNNKIIFEDKINFYKKAKKDNSLNCRRFKN